MGDHRMPDEGRVGQAIALMVLVLLVVVFVYLVIG